MGPWLKLCILFHKYHDEFLKFIKGHMANLSDLFFKQKGWQKFIQNCHGHVEKLVFVPKRMAAFGKNNNGHMQKKLL